MTKLWRAAGLLASFGFTRGGLFLAPILLANLLSPSVYGSLEFGHALASACAIFFALGTNSAVPLTLVRQVSQFSWRSIILHQASIATTLGTLTIVLWVFGFPDVVLFVVFGTAILMLQGLWSVTLKSLGHGEASLLLDFGFWGVLSAGVYTAYLFSASGIQSMQMANMTLAAYFLSLYAWTLWRFRTASGDAIAGYGNTVLASAPLMAAGLLALLATTSGRLGIGLLSSPEMTAEYSILFRATALPIVAHQVIIVARFRHVFSLPVGELQKLLPLITALVALSVVGFWLLADWLGFLLGPAFEKSLADHRVEGLLILAQSILWSAIALNDLVNNRSRTSKQAARAAALYIAVALLAGWWFLSGTPVTLAIFVPVHSLVMLGYLVIQIWVMSQCGIQLWRMWLLALASFVSFSLAAFAGLL